MVINNELKKIIEIALFESLVYELDIQLDQFDKIEADFWRRIESSPVNVERVLIDPSMS